MKLLACGRRSDMAAAPVAPTGLYLSPAPGSPAGSAHDRGETPPLLHWARRKWGLYMKPGQRCGHGRATGIGPGHWFLFCCYLDTY